jgi:hypothetical protein
MPTRRDRRSLYLIENIGGCARLEGLGKGQISGLEQNQGAWFNLKRRAEQQRLILTLTNQEVEES